MSPGDGAAPLPPFAVKDCALAALATGRRAQNLRELREGVASVDVGCIYHHFWGVLLRPSFDDPEYNNDLASWVHRALHDKPLAERLAVVDPGEFPDLEDLRREVVELIDQRIDELDRLDWARPDQQFHFVRTQTVVFDTGRRLLHARELADVISKLSLGSVYYHMIDARRRVPLGQSDFSAWLQAAGGELEALRVALAGVDPYFTSLHELRDELSRVVVAAVERLPS